MSGSELPDGKAGRHTDFPAVGGGIDGLSRTHRSYYCDGIKQNL
ncbi:hypothetical protein IMSAGC022_01440 [Alistipes sp.]|nr:hypothetical protein IMSAGC022_01440 [Alistipes sp.]